jgi:hypothetical protein
VPSAAAVSAAAVRSSTTPTLVVPAVATTASIRRRSSSDIVAMASSSASRVRRPRSSDTTMNTSTSMTRAAWATLECAPVEHRIRPRVRSYAPSPFVRHRWRAATSAERFPAVPPETNTPPASAGNPTRSAIQRSAWFSAKIAPAPSIQLPP